MLLFSSELRKFGIPVLGSPIYLAFIEGLVGHGVMTGVGM